MLVAIIADTHISRAGRRWPEACLARLRAADLIVHAGDLIAMAVLVELRSLGPPLLAVAGNVDQADVRAMLPQRAIANADGARIGIVHDAGSAAGRLERLRRWFPEADAVVFGHSHMPMHERAPDGFQIFNPGSPTERRRAPAHTMGIARASATSLQFELVVVDQA
jgi:putative phosphoesterase